MDIIEVSFGGAEPHLDSEFVLIPDILKVHPAKRTIKEFYLNRGHSEDSIKLAGLTEIKFFRHYAYSKNRKIRTVSPDYETLW